MKYKNITELTNLSAFTMYVINVSAVSSGGVGPWNTIKVRTDDAGIDDLRWTTAQLRLLLLLLFFFSALTIVDCLFKQYLLRFGILYISSHSGT